MKMKHVLIAVSTIAIALLSACTTIQTPNGPRTVLTPNGTEAIRAVTNIGTSTLAGYIYNGKQGAGTAAISSLAGNAASALVGLVAPQAQSSFGSYNAPAPASYYQAPGDYAPRPSPQYQASAGQIIGYTDTGLPIYKTSSGNSSYRQPQYANVDYSAADRQFLLQQ